MKIASVTNQVFNSETHADFIRRPETKSRLNGWLGVWLVTNLILFLYWIFVLYQKKKSQYKYQLVKKNKKFL